MSGEQEVASGAPPAADGAWQPNAQLLQLLVDMGFAREMARRALFYTSNESADLAATWILETNSRVEAEDVPIGGRVSEEAYNMYKMVFVTNGELQMGVGKIAAQVAHAALGMHRVLLQDESKYGQMLLDWESFGETKIVLKGENTQHLIDLEKKSLSIGLPTYLVHDAGRTQIPEGSTTVLCIMGRVDLVDQVTGTLKLM